MKKNVVVICGGDSSEYEVSLNSGTNIFESIDTEKFIPWMLRIRFEEWVILDGAKEVAIVDKSDFSFQFEGKKIKADYAFIMIHGTPGENGVLQGYLDLLRIPYSASGVYASALTFHKYYCNNFLRSFNVKMAQSVYLRKGDAIVPERLLDEIGLPMFIKPSSGGSSFGVTKVKAEHQIEPAVQGAYLESADCLVEEFIEGMELAVGVCDLDGVPFPFLPTEVIPKGDFFDYDSKYTVGGATEITPARLSDEKLKECQELAVRIYKLIGCHGIVRVDFILKEDVFYFLEINTVPGMTETSFIPQQLSAMGLNLKTLVSQVIENDFRD
jgi:D-alanine-D-alanine ligase